MSYDFEKIFTYFTKDEKWIKKILVVSLYYIIGLLFFVMAIVVPMLFIKESKFLLAVILAILCLFLGAMFFCVPNGFCFQAGNMRLTDPNAKLPELKDFFKQAYIGFKFAIGWFILFMPLLIFCVIVAAVYPEYYNNSSNEYTLFSFGSDLLSNLLGTVLSCFVPIYGALFLEKLNPFSVLNLKKAFIKIKDNFVPYLIFLGILFVANILLGLSVILVLLIVGVFILPVLDVLVTLIIAEIGVQFMNLPSKNENTVENNNETQV